MPSLVVYLEGVAANQGWSRGILEASPDVTPAQLVPPGSGLIYRKVQQMDEMQCALGRAPDDPPPGTAALLFPGRAGVTLQSTGFKLGSKPDHLEGLPSAGRGLLTSQGLCALPCDYTPYSRTHCLDFLQPTRPCQGETSTLTPTGLKAADTHFSSWAPGIHRLSS